MGHTERRCRFGAHHSLLNLDGGGKRGETVTLARQLELGDTRRLCDPREHVRRGKIIIEVCLRGYVDEQACCKRTRQGARRRQDATGGQGCC